PIARSGFNRHRGKLGLYADVQLCRRPSGGRRPPARSGTTGKPGPGRLRAHCRLLDLRGVGETARSEARKGEEARTGDRCRPHRANPNTGLARTCCFMYARSGLMKDSRSLTTMEGQTGPQAVRPFAEAGATWWVE